MTLDWLLCNAQIVDVFRLRSFTGWVGIRGGRYVYVEEGQPPEGLSAGTVTDLHQAWLLPGLIDAHMHIESSLIPPPAFARAVLPFGTTAVLADAHEAGNVAGEAGVRWMMQAARGLPLHIYHAIPSCVPATSADLEWTPQTFDAAAIRRLAAEPGVIALGEVMDYGSILSGEPRLTQLVQAAQAAGLLVEGHIPTLSGQRLSEYLAWRITSDHTQTSPAKLNEQISKGLAVMIQSKSCTPEIMAAVNALPDRSRLLLVTDDIEPPLLVKGHLSLIVNLAVAAGMPPLEAIASASLRPARYLGLRDQGGIAPGFRADFLICDDLIAFPPREVWTDGNLVAREGRYQGGDLPALPPPPAGYPPPGPFTPADFRLAPPGVNGPVTANAVTVVNTYNSQTGLLRLPVTVQDGFAVWEGGQELALAAVIARNRSSQSVGVLHNLGLRRGAVASSFAHDSHNLLVVGCDAASMAAAANAVQAMHGGLAVIDGGECIAALHLPIMGLLSDQPVEEVARQLEALENALRGLGVRHKRPFLMVSLLSLSVSPDYKFTDKGVIDTERRSLLPPLVP